MMPVVKKKNNHKKTTVTLTSGATGHSINGNKCTFNVTVPSGIVTTSPYEVYAAVGGLKSTSASGTSHQGSFLTVDDNNDKAYVNQYINLKYFWTKMTEYPYDPGVRDQIVQVARLENVPANSTSVALFFKHIGALIVPVIGNSTGSRLYVRQMLLEDVNNTQWVYTPDAKYDIVAGAMQPGSPTSNTAFFYNDALTTQHQILTSQASPYAYPAYRWVIPTGNVPSTLRIKVKRDDVNYNILGDKFIDLSGAKTITPGVRYRINRRWDGTNFVAAP